MLWAIDVGNTHTVVGLYDGGWKAVWRLATHSGDTEDQLMATLGQLCEGTGLAFEASEVVVGSVVPSSNPTWQKFAKKWLKQDSVLIESGQQVGLEVTYDPPHAVGADRIANALAAIELVGAPAIVVDFGTATTFDTIDDQGRYIGGSIMPGVLVSLEALATKAAKLPSIALAQPQTAIGRNTVDALRSGVMLGYAGAVDNVLRSIKKELGGRPETIGTGGLASAFLGLCCEFERVEPTLTLDGLRLALRRASGS